MVLPLVIVGCTRERPSEEAPIHLNPNMDSQPKYKAQGESEFFDDGATMRAPVAGTVARGDLREDDRFYKGKNADGSFVENAPVEVNSQLLNRGKERYDIYCAPCHSRVGDGRGIMVDRGYVPPPTFHSDRIREMPDGGIFDVITNGVRNMPGYRHQINPKDRWAIVMYTRALQRSRNATIDDIPIELRETVR
jgi:mono/diheme cytochrome c family protein